VVVLSQHNNNTTTTQQIKVVVLLLCCDNTVTTQQLKTVVLWRELEICWPFCATIILDVTNAHHIAVSLCKVTLVTVSLAKKTAELIMNWLMAWTCAV